MRKHNGKVRLFQIDAPDLEQLYSQKAKQHLSAMIHGQTVSIENKDLDRYEQRLGIIWLENNNRKSPHDAFAFDINLIMINQGYAWYYQ